MQRNQQGFQFLSWKGLTCVFIIFSLLYVFSPCCAQESSIGIDVAPKVVESNQNFSVSVYDPSIQNGSPYLVDVTILFNKEYFQILPDNENGEITLTAPEVLVNKTFYIEAFYEELQTNTSILVIPNKTHPETDLVITTDTYVVEAYEDFSILITDKNGKPIENVLVIIEESSASKGSGITNAFGKVELSAPNVEIITIRAEKIGYESAMKTINVKIKGNFIQQILSHPYTPIIGSIIGLIGVICYVTLSNFKKTNPRTKTLKKINQKQHTYTQSAQRQNKTLKSSGEYGSNIPKKSKQQIEEIHITNPVSKKITQIDTKNCQIISPSHRWFNKQNKKQNKQQKMNQGTRSKSFVQGTEDIHKKIDAVLAKKE